MKNNYIDKSTLKTIDRLTAELTEMKRNIKPKVTDNINTKEIINISVPDAFEVIKKFIKEEIPEYAGRENYNALGCCDEAKQHLAKLEQFFEDSCDYCF